MPDNAGDKRLGVVRKQFQNSRVRVSSHFFSLAAFPFSRLFIYFFITFFFHCSFQKTDGLDRKNSASQLTFTFEREEKKENLRRLM